MIIYRRIDDLIKEATLTRRTTVLETYRSIKCAFQAHETAKNAKPIDDVIEIEILKKLSKQALESAEIFKENGIMDLYEKRMAEHYIIAGMLPQEPTDKELIDFITSLARAEQNVSRKNMGAFIKATKEKYPTADGKKISTIVNEVILSVSQ